MTNLANNLYLATANLFRYARYDAGQLVATAGPRGIQVVLAQVQRDDPNISASFRDLIEPADFFVAGENVNSALDLVALCRP